MKGRKKIPRAVFITPGAPNVLCCKAIRVAGTTGTPILTARYCSCEGFYQEEGGPIRIIRPGDVVEIPTDIVHWHGATPDSPMTHLAIGTRVIPARSTGANPNECLIQQLQ